MRERRREEGGMQSDGREFMHECGTAWKFQHLIDRAFNCGVFLSFFHTTNYLLRESIFSEVSHLSGELCFTSARRDFTLSQNRDVSGCTQASGQETSVRKLEG